MKRRRFVSQSFCSCVYLSGSRRTGEDQFNGLGDRDDNNNNSKDDDGTDRLEHTRGTQGPVHSTWSAALCQLSTFVFFSLFSWENEPYNFEIFKFNLLLLLFIIIIIIIYLFYFIYIYNILKILYVF